MWVIVFEMTMKEPEMQGCGESGCVGRKKRQSNPILLITEKYPFTWASFGAIAYSEHNE
jgi:hypothetical protein